MALNKESKFHGAVIHKIVQCPQHKSINRLSQKRKIVSGAYLINDRALFCKYSNVLIGVNEYRFHFGPQVLDSILMASENYGKTFISLECGSSLVCLITFEELKELMLARSESAVKTENYVVIYVRVGRSFDVYTKIGDGTRGGDIAKSISVAKNAFPKQILES
jgi:hypothetical protein